MTRKSMDKVSKVARKATWGFALALAFCAMVVSGPVARAQVLYGSITGPSCVGPPVHRVRTNAHV
jgi:hypothetical protein